MPHLLHVVSGVPSRDPGMPRIGWLSSVVKLRSTPRASMVLGGSGPTTGGLPKAIGGDEPGTITPGGGYPGAGGSGGRAGSPCAGAAAPRKHATGVHVCLFGHHLAEQHLRDRPAASPDPCGGPDGGQAEPDRSGQDADWVQWPEAGRAVHRAGARTSSSQPTTVGMVLSRIVLPTSNPMCPARSSRSSATAEPTRPVSGFTESGGATWSLLP